MSLSVNPVRKPLVSIIMPCHNGSQFIRSAIQSVQAQTNSDWELLVIQNNSSDNSSELVQEFILEDDRIHELHCFTPGAAAARNLGIESARGRYIAFLDCDDQWLPRKLEDQLGVMNKEFAAFSWGSYEVMDAFDRTLRIQRCHPDTSYKDLLHKVKVIGCLTAMYDTHEYGKVLMPLIRMRQDYGLFLNLLRVAEEKGFKAVGLDTVVARYRVHSDSMTSNKLRAGYYQWRLYRDVEKLSLRKSLVAMVSYIFQAVIVRR